MGVESYGEVPAGARGCSEPGRLAAQGVDNDGRRGSLMPGPERRQTTNRLPSGSGNGFAVVRARQADPELTGDR